MIEPLVGMKPKNVIEQNMIKPFFCDEEKLNHL